MVAFTTNFRLAKPDFNTEGWDTQLNSDFDIIDAVLGQFNTGLTIQGVWLNSTLYAAGITAVDGLTGHIWQLSTTYTSSAAPGTFAQDRAANPTFWTDITNPAISAAASAANALVSANNAAASFASITALVGAGPSTGTGVLVLATGPTVQNITLAGASVFGGTISGTGIAAYLASPPAIGGTLPGAVNATNVAATGNVTAVNVTASGNVAASGNIAAVGALSGALRGFISGFTLSNDVGTPNTKLDISAGQCSDSTNATLISVGAFVKSISGTWVVGTGNNGMGNGLTATLNTWYHVFAIINAGTPDVYFDTSVTAANKPASTTAFRRLGSFKLDASVHILAFSQIKDRFDWGVPIPELTANVPGVTTAITRTLLGVPLGVITEVILSGNINDSTTSNCALYISSLAQTNVAANGGSAFTAELGTAAATSAAAFSGFRVMTDAAQNIRIRLSAATTAINMQTYGWIDTRGAEL